MYANCPEGSMYISKDGRFIKSNSYGSKTEWYYWCTYHKTWVVTEATGFIIYKLE